MCHENFRPLDDICLKKIYIVNALVSILNGNTLFIGNSQKEARYLSSPVYCCPVYPLQGIK